MADTKIKIRVGHKDGYPFVDQVTIPCPRLSSFWHSCVEVRCCVTAEGKAKVKFYIRDIGGELQEITHSPVCGTPLVATVPAAVAKAIKALHDKAEAALTDKTGCSGGKCNAQKDKPEKCSKPESAEEPESEESSDDDDDADDGSYVEDGSYLDEDDEDGSYVEDDDDDGSYVEDGSYIEDDDEDGSYIEDEDEDE